MTRQTSQLDKVNVQAGKVDALGERISVAIERAGGATLMSQKAGVSTSVLRKWRSGQSEPQVTSLVNMAKAAGVSVEWLATGRGESDQEAPSGLGEAHIDLDALEEVAVKVLALLDKRRPDLSAKARARIVRLVYEFYVRQEKPMDEASLNNVIELAAFR